MNNEHILPQVSFFSLDKNLEQDLNEEKLTASMYSRSDKIDLFLQDFFGEGIKSVMFCGYYVGS